ncbi:MAG: 1-acyl-sn-glycerol-3-phosphate acyltransferase [Bacteroidaceae bacterium]|nr:1-acyl-sn-glycerol-3-phosphate acyltransferase [Bacteroidaceae bacterium]
MRQHIQDDDGLYTFLLPVVQRATRRCFRRFHVSGWERVPKDGSVIFVTNHTCSLMDPLVMLRAEGKKVVFMARADMFRKPAVARILRWLRILPIYRIRDGVSAVKTNSEAIAEAVGVLRDRCPLCLYPEGTHRPKHSLLPLGKGVCHIAFEAVRDIGDKWPVYIVPAGIEYSDYFRFRPDMELQIGEPINVTEFVKKSLPLTPPEGGEASGGNQSPLLQEGQGGGSARAMNALRERIAEGMRPLFTWIPDDDDYDAIFELTKLSAAAQKETSSLDRRRDYNQSFIARLLAWREAESEAARQLFADALLFKKERERARVSVYSARIGRSGAKCSLVFRTLLALVLLPVWLACAVVCLPVWFPAELLAAKAKDAAWRNTRRFGICFVLKPLLTVMVAIPAFFFLPWYIALFLTALFFLCLPLKATYDGAERLRRLLSDWRWLFRPRLRRLYDRLRSLLTE